MKTYLVLALVGGLLSGCVTAQKGGSSNFVGKNIRGGLHQSENPKSESTQQFEEITEKVIPVQPGDKITGTDPDGKIIVIVPSKPATITLRTTSKVNTTIGAAQKDTGREIAAKLSSLKGVVWVGVLLFVFGAASAVYPPLKLIVGSLTTSAVCTIAGLALIFLPSLLVGHEILILSIGVGAAAVWWFAHRHGHLRGQLSTLLSK